jgi:hypothetical protein
LNCTWQEKSAVLLRMLAPGLDLAPAAQQRWPARLHEKARGLHVAAGAGAALLLPAWLHPPTGTMAVARMVGCRAQWTRLQVLTPWQTFNLFIRLVNAVQVLTPWQTFNLFHSSSKCSGAKEPMISSSSAFKTLREGPAHQPLRLDWQGYNARKESLSRRQNCVLFMGSVVCISQSRFCDSCELFEYILSIMNDYKYQIMY